VPRFQAFFVAQAGSVKIALSCPIRQQVTQTVGQALVKENRDSAQEFLP